MKVREPRAALFTLTNQDAEVFFNDPLDHKQMKVESVWVAAKSDIGAVGEKENMGVDDSVDEGQAHLSWLKI